MQRSCTPRPMRAREKKPGHDRQENPPPMEPATDFSGDNSRDYGVEATEARAVLRLLAKCCSATGCPNSLQTGILQGVGGGQPTSGRRRSFSIRPRRSGSRAAISLALPLHEKVGHSFPTFSPRPVPCRTVMYRSGARGVPSCVPDVGLPRAPAWQGGNRCRPLPVHRPGDLPMAKPTQYDAEHPEWRRAVEPTRTGRPRQRTNRPQASDERRPRQRAVFRQVRQPYRNRSI